MGLAYSGLKLMDNYYIRDSTMIKPIENFYKGPREYWWGLFQTKDICLYGTPLFKEDDDIEPEPFNPFSYVDINIEESVHGEFKEGISWDDMFFIAADYFYVLDCFEVVPRMEGMSYAMTFWEEQPGHEPFYPLLDNPGIYGTTLIHGVCHFYYHSLTNENMYLTEDKN